MRSEKIPAVRGPFSRPRVAVEYDPKSGLTKQSFKDECDITRIVENYARGIITPNRLEPQFGDAPEIDLFEAACAQAAIRTAVEEGYEPSESASEAPEGPISQNPGETQGSPETAPQGAPQDAADGESSGGT